MVDKFYIIAFSPWILLKLRFEKKQLFFPWENIFNKNMNEGKGYVLKYLLKILFNFKIIQIQFYLILDYIDKF